MTFSRSWVAMRHSLAACNLGDRSVFACERSPVAATSRCIASSYSSSASANTSPGHQWLPSCSVGKGCTNNRPEEPLTAGSLSWAICFGARTAGRHSKLGQAARQCERPSQELFFSPVVFSGHSPASSRMCLTALGLTTGTQLFALAISCEMRALPQSGWVRRILITSCLTGSAFRFSLCATRLSKSSNPA